MQRTIISTGIILILLLSSLSFNTIGEGNKGNIITVDDDGTADYTKIQDAIDNTTDGDTIYVYSGHYHERVIIDKPLTVMGEDKNNTIITSSFRWEIVEISKSNVIFSGFTINGSKDNFYCITIKNYVAEDSYKNTNVSLKNNIINGEGCAYCLVADNMENCEISNNHFKKKEVLLDNCKNNIISNNIFERAQLKFDDSNNNIVNHNIFRNIKYNGLYVTGSNNTFEYNDFIDNEINACLKSNSCHLYHNYWGKDDWIIFKYGIWAFILSYPRILIEYPLLLPHFLLMQLLDFTIYPKVLYVISVNYYGMSHKGYCNIDWNPALRPNNW